MRKILFLTIGDISKIATMKRALGMANPMQKLGWDVSIIAMDCEENRRRISRECNSTIKINYYKDTSALNESKDKTAIVNQLKPDFIYICSYSIRNRIIKNLLTSCKPRLLVEYSELISSINGISKARRWMHYYLEIKSIFYSDGLVCASQYLNKYFKIKSTFFGKKKLPILYSSYGYNKDIIDQPKKIFPTLKEKYNKIIILVYMGTMAKNYGLFTMLKAMLIISKSNKNVKLLLLGIGKDMLEAKEFVSVNNLHNYVEFLGYVPEDDISSYLELADMFISPLNNTIQDWARCPSKIYMYLPFNKPILTCEIGEAKEIFKDEGYYFDNMKPETLSGLIEKTMDKKIIHQEVDIFQHAWTKRAEKLDSWLTANFT